jgi:hypothetical protein
VLERVAHFGFSDYANDHANQRGERMKYVRNKDFIGKSSVGRVDSTQSGSKEQKQMVVQYFENELDAQIAKGHLEAEGIEASIIKDDIGGMFPSLQQPAGVQLLVSEARLAEAKKILQ